MSSDPLGPRYRSNNSDISSEIQERAWIPLVTCVIGTSSLGSPFQADPNNSRETSPCNLLTAFTLDDKLIANIAMLNGSRGSKGLALPSATNCSNDSPS